ncbi:MAG TPA: hypothetical protein VFU93_02735 [Acidimicrobiales bacterium]|nr:hypothetical protein [Acidimicrobiales bacterium]
MIRRSLVLLLPLLLLVAACGDDDGAGTASASGSGSGSGSAAAAEGDCEVVNGVEGEDSEVHVTLSEYAIDVEEDGAEAGIVKFEATNDGAVDHELVVLEGPADEVQVGDDGAPLEDGLIGEIEAFAPGTECQGSFELAAGTYTLLCAIVEESGESHFSEGMVTELEVK